MSDVPSMRSETAVRLDKLAEELTAIIVEDEIPFSAQQKLQSAATLVLGASNLIDTSELRKVRGD